MIVFLVTNEYQPESGGLSYSCRSFKDMLVDLGCDTRVLSSAVPSQYDILGGYRPSLSTEIALEEKFRKDGEKIPPKSLIISFGGGFNAYYGALLSMRKDCEFWVMFRGSDANIGKWSFEQTTYNQYAVNMSSKVFCLSEEIAQNLRFLLPKHVQVYTIPNSASRSIVPVKPFEQHRVIVGTGAYHLNEKKGVAKLIKMVAEYKRLYAHEDITLELAGKIDTEVQNQYKHLCKTQGVESSIKFLGGLNREEFRQHQSTWQLYVQASVCEGMGNSVVDAMSLGIPVMLSNTGFVAEMAQREFPTMLFSSRCPEQMAIELHTLLHTPNIVESYENFYRKFFALISYNRNLATWASMLQTPCQPTRSLPQGILSVVLHDVNGNTHDSITTPINVFAQFVEDVALSGYGLCSLAHYLKLSKEEQRKWIVCTFDDGYEGLLHHAFPVLEQYNFTASVYVCTAYCGQKNDWNFKDSQHRRHLSIAELKILQQHGWEIGSHGVSHQSLLRLSDEEVRNQLSTSKKFLEQHFGYVNSYAYPYGDANTYIEHITQDYYEYSFKLSQGGSYLGIDNHRIRRYYISEIYHIIQNL